MYYLADVDGYIGDFGSMETVNAFRDIAKKLDLKELTTLFTQGFSIKKRDLVADFKSIDYNFTELEGIADQILLSIGKGKEIIILSNNV